MPVGKIRIAVFCLALASCSRGVQAQATPPATTAQALFDFHSGFWINLHHFLYLEAAALKASGPHPPIASHADAEIRSELTPAERPVWDAAVSYYQGSVIQRDLLFDEGMTAIKNQLEDAEASSDLAHVDIPSPLRDVLLKAAPLYRNHWWTTHDRQNQMWIENLRPLLDAHATALRDSMVRIYESPWPGQPVRVDVTVYAGPLAAYTTNQPTRPTVSSRDPRNQGTAALEILFHETSHGMIRKVSDAINAAQETAHRSENAPRSAPLWHAVLFYTAGELVAERIPGYVPYADKNSLWVRAWPDPVRALIEQDWKPHMAGSTSLSVATTKLVSDIAGAHHPQ